VSPVTAQRMSLVDTDTRRRGHAGDARHVETQMSGEEDTNEKTFHLVRLIDFIFH
jgi:hypothetical protein